MIRPRAKLRRGSVDHCPKFTKNPSTPRMTSYLIFIVCTLILPRSGNVYRNFGKTTRMARLISWWVVFDVLLRIHLLMLEQNASIVTDTAFDLMDRPKKTVKNQWYLMALLSNYETTSKPMFDMLAKRRKEPAWDDEGPRSITMTAFSDWICRTPYLYLKSYLGSLVNCGQNKLNEEFVQGYRVQA